MDKTYLNTLHRRKIELQQELDNINNILQLYPDENYDSTKLLKTKLSKSTASSSLSVKEMVLNIIENLGGQIDVNQLADELKKQYPDKDDKAIKNQARNHLHILKNNKKISAEKIGINKWVYRIIK